MNNRFYPKLIPGKAIAIYSPSSNVASKYPDRLIRSVKALERTLNTKVVLPEQVCFSRGFTAGAALERAQAFESLLLDQSIAGIMCSIGGFNSAEILEHLNRDIVCRYPKVLIGNSDATALILGIFSLSGWTTYFGPTLLPQFGEYPQPFAFTIENLFSAIGNNETLTELRDPAAWTREFTDWGESPRRRRLMGKDSHRIVYREGLGEGILFGGNIETLNMLVGTPYLNIPSDIIFFWEAHAEEARLERVRRALTHLRQSGILSHVRGMLIGRSPYCTDIAGVTLKDTVLEACADFDFPIVANLSFGHTDPMLTLPIGVLANVCVMKGSEARITIV
ncbi:S66 family peptidase [Microbulbifer sp. ANSA005]|uniref:S66 family peptidase n=1 Tax=Microbulbifer sp. ANSA005 TaxID=3243362 RepID=UPI0040416BA6